MTNDFYTAIEKLLIEPVWNRNIDNAALDAWVTEPFNRTSMESKRMQMAVNKSYSQTFNRTSMESKLTNYVYVCIIYCRDLLIEPVWNRNLRA